MKNQPPMNPAWENEIKKQLDKIWENRFNISFRNLEALRRFANKKH